MAPKPFFTAVISAAHHEDREAAAIVSEHLRAAFRQAGGEECDIVMVAVAQGDGQTMVELVHVVAREVQS